MPVYHYQNCPEKVKKQLDYLVDSFKHMLTNDLVGIYLHGSLALGCFNPLRSDLDLLVVTQSGIDANIKRQLGELLLESSGKPCPVEISFLNWADLFPWRHPTPYDFHYSESWRDDFTCALSSGEWQNWNAEKRLDGDLAGHIMVLGQRGVCLWGMLIADVFPVVPDNDYLDSILRDVLDTTFGVTSDLSHPAYVLLNACRTYAYLITGAIFSKQEGGEWALKHLPKRFHSLIQTTLHAYTDEWNDKSIEREDAQTLANYLQHLIEGQLKK